MPDGERPEELAFSVARIEKPQRKGPAGDEFRACSTLARSTAAGSGMAEFLGFCGPIGA